MKKETLNQGMRKDQRLVSPEKPWFLAVLIGASCTTALLLIAGTSFIRTLKDVYTTSPTINYEATPTQLLAIIHYATSNVVPQQSRAEIQLSFDVLKSLAPCNFLVFGLGHDSLMWASLNPRGNTLFLEEDPKWFHEILRHAPNLCAHVVKYNTHLNEADKLISYYRQERACRPSNVDLKGNKLCKLALNMLPDDVYDKEWDVIMIDAPKGYYAEAPGRMGAIFSAAVMSRARIRPGVTHVFLHDVNRKVEKMYAREFLCMKYMVQGEGRLWHFVIPSLGNRNDTDVYSNFC